ncbi:hypothetical protein [Streptomyces nogalater]|uniref:Uncharacterized protein n=1 Tax=Streptomyces nogalater TaxID=38314 RepID=A0ABW0WF29_STRNO
MPEQVAEAIVRLEAHNLRVDEELAKGQRESIELQKAAPAVQQAMVRAMERIADRLEGLALPRPLSGADAVAPPTTKALLADWRQRLSVVNACLRPCASTPVSARGAARRTQHRCRCSIKADRH